MSNVNVHKIKYVSTHGIWKKTHPYDVPYVQNEDSAGDSYIYCSRKGIFVTWPLIAVKYKKIEHIWILGISIGSTLRLSEIVDKS